jgi:3-hydroxymyristoyl/3-hydroxydecanoyl-(acyl carrier protein) dehydratase
VTVLKKSLPADHPAAQGHFPGNPVIPGAVLLSETVRMIEAALGRSLSPLRIGRAKFPHPARPGDELHVAFRNMPGSIRFECAVGGITVLTGEVECCASSSA